MNTVSINSSHREKCTRIVIVDDHPMIREGLQARLCMYPDLEVCGEAATVNDALALMRAVDPQLMIIDLALKGGHGLDLIKRIRLQRYSVKILVMSAYPESLFAERVLRAGAEGFISKEALQTHVIEAVRCVLRGEPYLSPEMSRRLLSQAVKMGKARQGLESLTDREMQIFELIGQGLSTNEVARQLVLSVHTIETYREKIRHKLHLRNGTELMFRAVEWQLNRSSVDSP